MEEIDIRELFSYLRSKMPILILIIFMTCIVGGIYSIYFKTPLYNSSSTIVLATTEANATAASAQVDVTVNQKLVGTYQEIVKSRSVLESVIKKLNLKQTYEELLEETSVTSVENTEIIKITVTNENPRDARDISLAVANTFSKEVGRIYSIKNINVLDEADIANEPYNINLTKEMIIYFALGFALGMGLLFIMFYFDKTIRSVEQVEMKLGLPILGKVPVYSGKDGR
ncbi:MAG: Wzz/FepE/Etk N-terminal domain-containing protein [Bacilli bacterium]|nr:Wzz/FepE/Etk N-terminal domain-containing protein [Bacilli bacterium]